MLVLGFCAACASAAPPKRVKVVPKLPPATVKPALPAGPGQLTLLKASDREVELRWDAVSGAIGYEVLVRRDGEWRLNEDDPNYVPMTNSTTLPGLGPGTTLEVSVRAVLPGGLTQLSPPLTVKTTEVSPMVSAPPSPSTGSAPLPVVDNAPIPDEKPAPAKEADDPALAGIDLNAPITDLVPPPPKPAGSPAAAKAASTENRPVGPPPPAPEGAMAFFAGDDTVRLSWRVVREATGYIVEEQKEGQWITPEGGVIQENRPSFTLKRHPSPGPYWFRVTAVRYGVRSNPGWPVKVER